MKEVCKCGAFVNPATGKCSQCNGDGAQPNVTSAPSPKSKKKKKDK